MQVAQGSSQLSISAWLTARYNEHHNFLSKTERDRVRFLLFCSVWTIVLAPVFLTSFLTSPGSIFASVAAHGILCVLGQFVAPVVSDRIFLQPVHVVGVLVGGCSRTSRVARREVELQVRPPSRHSFVRRTLTLYLAHSHHFVYCGQLNALEAFAWIEWYVQ